jgi:hypothetical protein
MKAGIGAFQSKMTGPLSTIVGDLGGTAWFSSPHSSTGALSAFGEDSIRARSRSSSD